MGFTESVLVSKIPAEIVQNPALSEAVEKANRLIGDEFRSVGGNAVAEWTVGPERSDRITLIMSSGTPPLKVKGQFAPEEFQNEAHLKYRLRHLWGDLLRQRSHQQLKALFDTAED
jgi:hypothetical protein